MSIKFHCFLFGFFLITGLAMAQDDAYDAYLNKGKKPKKEHQRTDKMRSTADLRSRLMSEAGASFHLFDAGLGRFMLPGVQFIARADMFGNGDGLSGTLGVFPMLGFQVDPWFGNFFMFNLPLMFEMNAGLGSYNYNESWIGVSLGLGPEYNFIRTNGDFGANQLGLSGSFSLRFALAGRRYYIRVSESLLVPQNGLPFFSVSFGNSFF
ncbi:MAG: hypothetical protein ACK417_06315 [Bacteroidia bacterium]